MKRIFKAILKKIFPQFLSPIKVVNYKHGNRFYNNTHIDTLIPQFVEIGDNFISAPGSLITAHDASTFLFTGKYRIEKVKIGNNVFLGANSVVLPGVIIGDNVIIGAGAVVSRNLKSNGVYAGNPAKLICTVEEYIQKLDRKGVLFEPPKNFVSTYESGTKFNKEVIESFQKKAIKWFF